MANLDIVTIEDKLKEIISKDIDRDFLKYGILVNGDLRGCFFVWFSLWKEVGFFS